MNGKGMGRVDGLGGQKREDVGIVVLAKILLFFCRQGVIMLDDNPLLLQERPHRVEAYPSCGH